MPSCTKGNKHILKLNLFVSQSLMSKKGTILSSLFCDELPDTGPNMWQRLACSQPSVYFSKVISSEEFVTLQK